MAKAKSQKRAPKAAKATSKAAARKPSKAPAKALAKGKAKPALKAKSKAPVKPVKVVAQAKAAQKGLAKSAQNAAKAAAKTAAKTASKTIVVKAARIMNANGPQGAVVRAIQATSSQDLRQAAKTADQLTTQSQGKKRRGKAGPQSIYAQSLSSLNRVSGSTPVMTSSHHSENGCREVSCEQIQTASGYCRVHYIKNWGQIKRKEVILKEKKLDRFIEEIVAKYPEKYVEAIKLDLLNDRSFAKVVADLELEGSAIDDPESAAETEAEPEAEAVIDSFRRDFDGGEAEGF